MGASPPSAGAAPASAASRVTWMARKPQASHQPVRSPSCSARKRVTSVSSSECSRHRLRPAANSPLSTETQTTLPFTIL
eukprot:742250-Prymnesium_polylepis.1